MYVKKKIKFKTFYINLLFLTDFLFLFLFNNSFNILSTEIYQTINNKMQKIVNFIV